MREDNLYLTPGCITSVAKFDIDAVVKSIFSLVFLHRYESFSLSLRGTSKDIWLGKGPLSLVSQLINGKFSYCLLSYFTDDIVNATAHLFVDSSANLNSNKNVTVITMVTQCRSHRFKVLRLGTSNILITL
ncbi:hypothetical protein CFC21_110414 [Triticum aestivum]|uniref:Uncharacterized protein n=4 Tax=Triticinae TaxID=1648030 RepID=A0A9R1NDX4_WHEAT|nr:hypothetical protein CFC21_047626 [Triticum aestivum]KAF7110277.1 hypothetical protein CFC21_110413 [Triticum aestivum]KAF7110278.1 hypothetical protein CFC21_110414 [Triticum aestivum]